MSITCQTNTDLPELTSEECNGEYTQSMCTIHPTALTYLNLPANSSIFTIINTFILALQYKGEQISTLQDSITALEDRVLILEP